MTRTAALCLPLLLAGALLTCSCGRTTVSVTFGGDPSRLDETPVLDRDSDTEHKIAMIDLRGLIVDGPRAGIPFLQSAENPVDELVARLDKARRDASVRAVILRINSPGGAVTASDTMYREIRRFREQSGKPVVASMGEIAASGGYYVALAADAIIAQPTTITGSVGVIIPTVNFSDGLKRIGIVSRSIKSGANKDLANPMEPIREGQYAVLQSMVDQMYARFNALVHERRATQRSAGAAPVQDDILDGRVIVGDDALAAGLVDGVGDVRDAFDKAKALAGIPRARMVKYHAQGDTPKTAYAVAGLSAAGEGGPGAPTGGDVNLIRVQLGDGALPGGAASLSSGVAYYLWSPAAW